MGQIADIATAIKVDLDTVTDAGITYPHGLMPVDEDWAEFIRALTVVVGGQRQVRAWTIQYLNEKRAYRNVGSTKVLRTITFVVRFHLSMTEVSDLAFRTLLEAAVTAIDSDPGLGGTCIDHDACDVAVPENGALLFMGDVLCQYAEITVVARAEQTL